MNNKTKSFVIYFIDKKQTKTFQESVMHKLSSYEYEYSSHLMGACYHYQLNEKQSMCKYFYTTKSQHKGDWENSLLCFQIILM